MYIDNKFVEKHVITCYHSDYHRRMSPSGFLDLAQQIAYKAAQEMVFSSDNLAKYNCTWVLTRMQVRFEKPVMYDDEVILETWHSAVTGLNFVREFQLRDKNGDVRVNSNSSWIVIDMGTRSISRDREMWESIMVPPQREDKAIETAPPKVLMPRGIEAELIGSHSVGFSDIDVNQHVNNVKYTVWSMDALPKDLVFKCPLKEMQIVFHHEALPGDVVELYHIASDEKVHYVEGRVGDSVIFTEKLIFE